MKIIKESLSRKQANEIAKKVLQNQIGIAYYSLENREYTDDYSEEEINLIKYYLDKQAARACKAVGIDYITY